MKITKKELMRIIKEEVNKVRIKGPLDQKRLVPDFPKDIPSSDVATSVVELYRSVDAISTSVMEMSARIDGIQEAIKKISSQVARNKLNTSLLRDKDTSVDWDDSVIVRLRANHDILFEMVEAMYNGLPEDLQADIEAEHEALRHKTRSPEPTELQKAHGIVPDEEG